MVINLATNGVRIVVFKKMLAGDILKVNNISNEADSGGGARDFRFPLIFRDIFKRMFPEDIGNEIHRATFHWDKHPDTTTHVYLKPTNSRPNEVRISKVGECFRYLSFEEGDILLLVMDSNCDVWPYLVKPEYLKNSDCDQKLAKLILGCYNKKKGSISPAGYVDYENNVTYDTMA